MHRSALRGFITLNISLLGLAAARSAHAEPAAPSLAEELAMPSPEPTPPPAHTKPKPPPYSLPWQLRPAVVGNVVRSDTTFAFYESPTKGDAGRTAATMLLATYKVTENIAPLVRIGLTGNTPPASAVVPGTTRDLDSAVNFLNPVLGATYALKPAVPLRLAFFLGLTLPIGSGGGDDASPEAKQANTAGIRARSAMDNAMYSVNDFVIFPGVDLAYVSHGFTAQVEATLLELLRVKGDGGAKPVNPDESKTNFTAGLHVGYFVLPMLSLGAELRHQRFLSTPKGVEADEALPDAQQQGLRDTTTWAIGPRFHFKLSDSVWFRPGVAFSMPLDDPMKKSEYKVVQLDLPLAF